jgi:hypothetical protein
MAMWWQLFSNGALHPLPLLVGLALATGVAPAASCRFPFSDPSGTSTVEYDWHAGADIVRTTSIGWEGPTGRWSVIQADLGTGVGGQSTHQFYDAMGAVNRSFRVVYQTNDDGSRGPALDCTTQEGDFLDLDGLQFLRQGPFDPQEVEDVFLTVGESDDEVKMCTEKLGEVTVGRSRMAVWGGCVTNRCNGMRVFPIRIHCNKDFGIARAVYPSTEERRGTTCDLRPYTVIYSGTWHIKSDSRGWS